jgi:hypothetical protein
MAFFAVLSSLFALIRASAPCEQPLNCGEYNKSSVCNHTFTGCDVCDTCCQSWLKPVDMCDGCVEDECTSGRHPNCCVSFECVNGQCQRAALATGKYPTMASCEKACSQHYDCVALPSLQCKPVGQIGHFNSSAACNASCGITCPAYAQQIGGYCYAVMEKTLKATKPNTTACSSFPNCTQDCQVDYIQMPLGWELAPCPTAEVRTGMWSGGSAPNATTPPTYAWGCDYLLYGGGCGSATWVPGIWAKGIDTMGSAYKAKECQVYGQKVVMRIPATRASSRYY